MEGRGNDKSESIQQDELLLYSKFLSSCSWRVRIVLEHKGLKYDIAPIILLESEDNGNLHPDFLKLNPMGQIPALVINKGEMTLTQSIAIMEYLEERYPENPLMPKDLKTRAIVRQICELIASGIQPLQNMGILHKVSDNTDTQLEWAQHWIRRGLAALETLLLKTSGSCSVGDTVTFADCCLVPQIANAHRFKVDISAFTTLIRIDKHLSSIPAFQRAHASNQPDTPKS